MPKVSLKKVISDTTYPIVKDIERVSYLSQGYQSESERNTVTGVWTRLSWSHGLAL